MAPTQPFIRHARREDVPAILDLIKELADYEKELSSVEATEAKLLSTLAFAPSTPAAANPSTPTNEHGDDGGPTPGQLPVTDPITPTAPARCLLLFPNPTAAATDKPVGMALYFYNYSTWRAKAGIYLEDLYVTPAERNKGHGKRLLVALAKEVVAMDGGRLDWSVLKWNEPSIRFYEDVVGATRMEEWVGMRVDREALGKLATMLD
ncbi:Peroxygenase 1 [Gnomoniopsis sp. IMI 355080]|nr:Peroxygenase 1 [Gnomoniopsis sp. IMI 355080]